MSSVITMPSAEVAAAPVAIAGTPEMPVPPSVSDDLLRALKAWRLETARREGIPAYRVARDRSLEAVAEIGVKHKFRGY